MVFHQDLNVFIKPAPIDLVGRVINAVEEGRLQPHQDDAEQQHHHQPSSLTDSSNSNPTKDSARDSPGLGAAPQGLGGADSQSVVAAPAPRPFSVLVVDDNKVNLLLIKRMLTMLGCSVVTAESGDDAISTCILQTFDLIFMDFFLPGINGVEVTARLRSAGVLDPRATAVFVLTASSSPAVEKECAEAGLAILTKPATKAMLSDAIERVKADKFLRMSKDK